jgi:type II restriction/modification system DNA methylase subunit YeeA
MADSSRNPPAGPRPDFEGDDARASAAEEFIAFWSAATLSERSGAHSHFNRLCAVLDVPTPAESDPTGEWYTFEKGVIKSTGRGGFADVWKRGHFAWEYKAQHKDLDAALNQLKQYALALENPPLLVVSDMLTIRVHTNWTNLPSKVHTFTLDDLRDPLKRQRLRQVFTQPDAFRPDAEKPGVTEIAAEKFARLAAELRARGHDSMAVAHFINQIVFCLYADDVGLLPDQQFDKLLDKALKHGPRPLLKMMQVLFDQMPEGGVWGADIIPAFNGGLFKQGDIKVLPLKGEDLLLIRQASKLDWSKVDPTIFGTLFERGLDPDNRAVLGAHYTDREKIEKIITPVVTRPLLRAWEGVRAEIAALLGDDPAKASAKNRQTATALFMGYLEKLRAFTVLDPACGSGNFLYLALHALKDIERQVIGDAANLGVSTNETPKLTPANLYGIDINSYAVELARVSVWIGFLQWMREHNLDPLEREPILDDLGTIEHRDALFGDWPKVDAIVGNPPFIGDKKMRSTLGDEYVNKVRTAYEGRVPGGADFVCYWFERARAQIADGKAGRAGLVATNSIRGGKNRKVLDDIVAGPGIFEAWSDEPWTVDGAAVRVSLVCFGANPNPEVMLDGVEVTRVTADLKSLGGIGSAVDVTSSVPLGENQNVAFIGTQKNGAFDIPAELARKWLQLPRNPNGRPNEDVVRPWMNGSAIAVRNPDRWVIDFGCTLSVEAAALYEAPFEYTLHNVKAFRETLRRDSHRTYWWRHGEPRPGMRRQLTGLRRFLATPRVSKHRFFVWLHPAIVPDSRLLVIARDDELIFGIVHAKHHELWTMAMASWHGVGNDPTYNAHSVFETFPFPEGLAPNVPAEQYRDDPRAQAVAAAAKRLNDLREAWLNPPDLVRREPEVVPGFPDRIVPVSAEAAKVLAKRTLTNLYNQKPQWLRDAHAQLDAAVAAAYGWPADLDDAEILARLFALNQERARAGR